MKKNYILSGLMLIAALSLASCAKEQFVEQPAEKAGVPFEIVAGVDTKTTTADGTTINWADGDKLNVFHAPAGTTTYGSNDEFTFTSGNSFSGTLKDGALTADAYDWYALYPYYYSIATPANTSNGYTVLKDSQTQSGNNSKAHLAGSNFPLYGKVLNVAKDTKPSITVQQALSVIRVRVKNTTSKPLTVETVSFGSPQFIAGNFFIDFSGDVPGFTQSGTSGKNTVTLTVNGGTALNQNDEADFYIAVKPFTAAVGNQLTLKVNGYERAFTAGSPVEFAPGKIKTLKFNYDTNVESFTWDLSTNSYSAASTSQVTWTNENADMVVNKDKASTNANNYLGGTNSRTSSRFYAKSILSITPASGVQITKVVFVAASENYASALNSSTWTNANSSVDKDKVTITPIDGSNTFNATISETCGFTAVTVYHKPYVQRTLTSIEITKAPTKVDYSVGDTFSMDGAIVTANYDDSSTENVTAAVTTNGAEVIAHAGNAKVVTVSYQGKEATFNVNVAKGAAGLAFATPSYAVAPNADFDTPTLTNPHGLTVTYSSNDEDIALVDENTGDIVIGDKIGTATITASTAGNDDYNAGSASYTITVSNATDYSKKHDSNVTLSIAGGTNATAAKVVIGSTQYDAIKCGTNKLGGAMKLTVPSGTTKLHVHLAGWNGATVSITVTPKDNVSDSSNTYSISANSGVSGNSPFTLSGDASSHYLCINLKDIDANTELIFTSNGKRFVIWGVNAE